MDLVAQRECTHFRPFPSPFGRPLAPFRSLQHSTVCEEEEEKTHSRETLAATCFCYTAVEKKRERGG